MRLSAFIIRLIMCFVAAGFLISTAFSADNKNKNTATKSERGLKIVNKGDGRRIALVIGNSAYKYTGTLSNPANDARLIAETLKSVGFELYGGKPQINLSRDDMLTTIEGFGDRIGSGDTALFYYAGHGVQVKGENYLIPVNANIKNEAEVRVKSVESSLLFAKLEGAKNGVNIVILDACRNNPFGRAFRSANNGLAQVTAPSGTIVAFSTAPNQVAEDGSGSNSTYTSELAHFIKFPGLRIEDVFKRVRVAVEKTTGGNQQPWENTSLKGDFSFVEDTAEASNRQQKEEHDRVASDSERKAREAEERAKLAEEKARQAEQWAVEAEEKSAEKTAKRLQNQEEEKKLKIKEKNKIIAEFMSEYGEKCLWYGLGCWSKIIIDFNGVRIWSKHHGNLDFSFKELANATYEDGIIDPGHIIKTGINKVGYIFYSDDFKKIKNYAIRISSYDE